MNDLKLTINLNNGETKEYLILHFYDYNQQHYIIYTDGSNIDDIYVSKYTREHQQFHLLDIETEEEWNRADQELNKIYSQISKRSFYA